MGLLSQGTPLPWSEAKRYADHIRSHGIQQFLNTYRHNKDNGVRGALLWGDEVEYMLIQFDDAQNNVMLSLRGYDVLQTLMEDEEEAIKNGTKVDLLWRPEYARYMLEGTPGSPYGLKAEELLQVENNMKLRRQVASQHLGENEFLASITCFPRLGCQDRPFLYPCDNMSEELKKSTASCSLFVPDTAINPHPRFKTLTANIRERRGQKVSINLPIFKDTKTPNPFKEPELEKEYSNGSYVSTPSCSQGLTFYVFCWYKVATCFLTVTF
jgi:glutamate--cysteine ligase catalytic subunit